METTTLVHLRDIRLRTNAGMDYPVCRADDDTLDPDLYGTVQFFRDFDSLKTVSCAACRKAFRERYAWSTTARQLAVLERRNVWGA